VETKKPMGLKKLFKRKSKKSTAKHVRIVNPTQVIQFNSDDPPNDPVASTRKRLFDLGVSAVVLSIAIFSLFVFVTPFFITNDDIIDTFVHINSILLLLSGLIINFGTIVQIGSIIIYETDRLDGCYTQCLIIGCLTLLICQMFTYEHEYARNTSNLMTILTTCLSCTCTLTMYALTNKRFGASVLKFLKIKRARLPTRSGILKITTDPQQQQQSNVNNLVFLEGTSSVGKTSTSDVSQDMTKNVKRFNLYAVKYQYPYIQSMYEARIYLDTICLVKNYTGGTLMCDRMMFSQFVYSLVFHYKGHQLDPREFNEIVDKNVFENLAIVRELRELFQSWIRVLRQLNSPHTDNLTIVWVMAKNPKFTAQLIRERSEMEDLNTWNLENYVHNQNAVFQRLANVVDPEHVFSCTRYVDNYVTRKMILDIVRAKQTVDQANIRSMEMYKFFCEDNENYEYKDDDDDDDKCEDGSSENKTVIQIN